VTFSQSHPVAGIREAAASRAGVTKLELGNQGDGDLIGQGGRGKQGIKVDGVDA
jgi:hypothetical protein